MPLSQPQQQRLRAKFGDTAIVDFGSGFLSNYYVSPVVVDGVTYKSGEHAFQAQKAADPVTRTNIINAPTPGKAKDLGREALRVPGWFSSVRDVAMSKVVAAKVRLLLLLEHARSQPRRASLRVTVRSLRRVWRAPGRRISCCARACRARAELSRARAELVLQFAPGSVLATQLLNTGSRPLVEGNKHGDIYWCARCERLHWRAARAGSASSRASRLQRAASVASRPRSHSARLALAAGACCPTGKAKTSWVCCCRSAAPSWPRRLPLRLRLRLRQR